MITIRFARLRVTGSRWEAKAILVKGPTAKTVTVNGGACLS